MRTREAGEPLTALVVDDNTIMRGMVETLANGLDGVSVIAVADDGESAVRIAGTHHPDVVIMDVNMPGVNGVEATKRIRASLEDVAIVGVSMQDPEVEEAMRSAGAVEFVEKERLAEELPAAIYRAARRNAADPAGT